MRRKASTAQQRHSLLGWVAQQASIFVADARVARPVAPSSTSRQPEDYAHWRQDGAPFAAHLRLPGEEEKKKEKEKENPW